MIARHRIEVSDHRLGVLAGVEFHVHGVHARTVPSIAQADAVDNTEGDWHVVHGTVPIQLDLCVELVVSSSTLSVRPR